MHFQYVVDKLLAAGFYISDFDLYKPDDAHYLLVNDVVSVRVGQIYLNDMQKQLTELDVDFLIGDDIDKLIITINELIESSKDFIL